MYLIIALLLALFPTPAFADTTLVAAVTPSVRATQVGVPVTVWAVVINAGRQTAEDVSVVPVPSPKAPAVTFVYHPLDATGTVLTGTPNTPVDIPPGGVQHFLLTLTPTEESPPLFGPNSTLTYLLPRQFAFLFQGTNTPPAPTIDNINTLLFYAHPLTTGRPFDNWAIAATCPSNDGIPLTVNIPGLRRQASFTVAAAVQGAIWVEVIHGLNLEVSLCRTNAQGQCLAPPSREELKLVALEGEVLTFTVFVKGTGGFVPFDPAKNRITVQFSRYVQTTSQLCSPGGCVVVPFLWRVPTAITSVAVRTHWPSCAGDNGHWPFLPNPPKRSIPG